VPSTVRTESPPRYRPASGTDSKAGAVAMISRSSGVAGVRETPALPRDADAFSDHDGDQQRQERDPEDGEVIQGLTTEDLHGLPSAGRRKRGVRDLRQQIVEVLGRERRRNQHVVRALGIERGRLSQGVAGDDNPRSWSHRAHDAEQHEIRGPAQVRVGNAGDDHGGVLDPGQT